MKGEEVAFIGGSDEHGVPITLKTKNEGITPQDVVDKYHGIIKDAFNCFGISFEIYSHTRAKVHHETASEIFKNLAPPAPPEVADHVAVWFQFQVATE